ncbi:MAG TPA: urease accessory UreF family protein [Verrucomicrobiae bacterium]|nr:urease accessory UreF family protein [Verrucomicrobiae bacterium]
MSKSAVEQSEAAALLGEFSALLRRLGPGAPALYGADAQAYLEAYQSQVLIPIELPAIARAAMFAARGQAREFLLLDAQLADEPLLQPFADGSRQMGRLQLESLRPLRDERLARRYRAAVASGEAQGWHTVVFGLILAIYSWPLRQGLLHYGCETLAGLAASSGAPAAIDEAVLRAAVDQTLRNLESSDAHITSIASP